MLALLTLPASGCALVAGGIAGGVIATEIDEGDGKFDPLEKTDAGEAIYE